MLKFFIPRRARVRTEGIAAPIHEYEPVQYAPEARPVRVKRSLQETCPLVPGKSPVAKRVVLTAPLNCLTHKDFREADRSHIEYLDGRRRYLQLDQQVVIVRIRGMKKPDGTWSNYLEVCLDGVPLVTSLKDSWFPVTFAGHTFQMQPNIYKGQTRRPLLLEDGVVQWYNGRPAGQIERYIYRLFNIFHLSWKTGRGQVSVQEAASDRLRWMEQSEPRDERLTYHLDVRRLERGVGSLWQEYERSPGDVFLNEIVDGEDPPGKPERRTLGWQPPRRTTRLPAVTVSNGGRVITDGERILYELDDIQATQEDGTCAERYELVTVRSSDPYRTETGRILNDQRDADVAWLYQSLAHHGRWPKFVTDKGIKVYPHNPAVLRWVEGFIDDLNRVADGEDSIKQYYLRQLRKTWRLPKAKQLEAKRQVVAEVKNLAEGLKKKRLDPPEAQWILDDQFPQMEISIEPMVSSLRDRLLRDRQAVLGEIASLESYREGLYNDGVDGIEDLILPNRWHGNIRSVVIDEVRTTRAKLGALTDRLARIDDKLEALTTSPNVVECLIEFYRAPSEDPELEPYDEDYFDDGFDIVDNETGVVHYSSTPCLDGIHAAAFYGYRPLETNQVPDYPLSAREIVERALQGRLS